jgi:Family of unknown function (DUF6159)
MEKITRTWSLMKMSWRILMEDKKILIFPLLSGLSCLATFAAFIIPLVMTHKWKPPVAHAPPQELIAYYGFWFLFYYCNYFLIVFFNAALVSHVVMRMNGDSPTIGDGFNAAVRRLPLIVGWALIAATVGFALKIIEDRSDKIGSFVAAILGGAWGMVTFLVIPVLVVEQRNPFSALKESTVLLKKTWGERIMMNFSFSTISFLLSLPVIGIVVMGILSHNTIIMAVCIASAVLFFILLALVQSALEAIFQTAIYFYARNNQVPNGFDESVLQDAMAPR